MSKKIEARLVKTSNFEAVVLTDDELPLSEVEKIQKKDSGLVLIAGDERFEFAGSLTGLETVYLWTSSQSGKSRLEEPKAVQWAE